ncbi:MAG TPA: HEAT repeat domain-containing protein [Candidatus Aerophobetes bacterium]|uniref:HEAT repeat domain-containing protein n=1 Tax=Aerophobetes bacterium TaxID=2030807 RepID=A0A7V5HZU3_UNCAE|nr:HEAT repeat domain-containing protein [Candidatus Aerophobetes bacterium]
MNDRNFAPKFHEVIKKVKSKDEEDRRWAAHILGEMGEKEGVSFLVELLCDESDAVREKAAESLVRIDGREVVQKVVPFLRSEKAYLRNIACEILEGIGEDAIEHLSPLLKDKDNDVRKFVCDIMGNVGSAKALPYLISALDDPHINVACAACEALGNIGDKNATSALLGLLKKIEKKKILDEEKKWLISTILEAIGKIKDPRAFKEVMKLSSSKDPLILFSLINCLGEMGDSRAIGYLLSCLGQPLFGIPAIKALAKVAEKNEKEVFLALKNSAEKLVFLRGFLKKLPLEAKREAIFLAGVAKDKEAVPLLLPFLFDEEEKIREETVKALLKINLELTFLSGQEDYIEAIKGILEVFLYDNDEELRKKAGRLLRKLTSA